MTHGAELLLARLSPLRFCATVRASHPNVLDQTADILCSQKVAPSVAAQAQRAMQQQREHMRVWQQGQTDDRFDR